MNVCATDMTGPRQGCTNNSPQLRSRFGQAITPNYDAVVGTGSLDNVARRPYRYNIISETKSVWCGHVYVAVVPVLTSWLCSWVSRSLYQCPPSYAVEARFLPVLPV